MSSSEAIVQCVIIYPHPDKWAKVPYSHTMSVVQLCITLDYANGLGRCTFQVKTLMEDIANSVKEGEPGTLIYAIHENITNPDAPMLLIWEKYVYNNPPFRLLTNSH
ncbi:hypothetical protein F5Y01DRAFT_320596 [Xylaria sp. FL0043]|nr:hypothetical protein F5Y01DRAFT_320596 [Xylaria sp. FL0043]